jgi:hypothetical protein
MSPKSAIVRGMWVAILIGVLVMHAMGCNPEQGSSFEGQRTAHRQDVFHPLGSLVTAMRKQPMVSHPNAEAPRNPPQQPGKKQSFPTEYEERRHCACVKEDHEEDRYPNSWLSEGPVASEES